MRSSFVIYTDWLDMVRAMDDDSRGQLFLAIMEYEADEEVSDMDPPALVAFACMKTQLDKDEEKYQESMIKRSEAGKIAAKARVESSNRNESQRIVTNRNESQRIVTNRNESLHDNVYVNDNVNDKRERKEREHFSPPTVEQVKEYAAEKGYAIDAERFVDYYQTNGWMAGKNHMKDWKAAVRNWSRNDKERQGKTAKPKTTDFQHRDYDFTELNRKLFTGGMTKEG